MLQPDDACHIRFQNGGMTPIEMSSVDGVHLEATVHQSAGQRPWGTVILAHGITVDMDEGGMFVRLAERLVDVGLTTFRFSYRGHGRSGGTQRGVTIAGELLDVQAVVDHAAHAFSEPLAIVAASFGAVSTTLSLPYLPQVSEIVLWNPVLDLDRTFITPELPWGLANFGQNQQRLLRTQGFLLVDGEFELGRVMFESFGGTDRMMRSFPMRDPPWSSTGLATPTSRSTSHRMPPGSGAAGSTLSATRTTDSTRQSVSTKRSRPRSIGSSASMGADAAWNSAPSTALSHRSVVLYEGVRAARPGCPRRMMAQADSAGPIPGRIRRQSRSRCAPGRS